MILTFLKNSTIIFLIFYDIKLKFDMKYFFNKCVLMLYLGAKYINQTLVYIVF